MSRRQLITADEAVEANGQHTKPCGDCPWARKSLPGWLGGPSADDWLKEAHGDHPIPCHTLRGAQCAGAAIYRRNVVKNPRDEECLRLEANRELVFAAPSEFKAHHEARITTKAGETAEGERLMPKEEVIATNMKLKTAKAAHVEATKALKDKHAKTVNALKEGTAKKVAAAEAKGKKKIDSVLTTVDKMDALAVEIIGLTDGTSKLKPEQIAAKVNALAGKIRKLADKHLA